MEFLSQYNSKIVYVKGEDNTVADALSRLPDLITTSEMSAQADLAATPLFHIAPTGEPIASVLKINHLCPIMVAAT